MGELTLHNSTLVRWGEASEPAARATRDDQNDQHLVINVVDDSEVTGSHTPFTLATDQHVRRFALTIGPTSSTPGQMSCSSTPSAKPTPYAE